MEYLGLGVLQLVDGEGSRLGQHALGAVVHILTILILEEHVRRAVMGRDADACLAQFLHLRHHILADGGDQMETDVAGQSLQCPGHIVGGASGTVGFVPRRHDSVAGNVPDTAYFIHKYVVFV